MSKKVEVKVDLSDGQRAVYVYHRLTKTKRRLVAHDEQARKGGIATFLTTAIDGPQQQVLPGLEE